MTLGGGGAGGGRAVTKNDKSLCCIHCNVVSVQNYANYDTGNDCHTLAHGSIITLLIHVCSNILSTTFDHG